VLQEAHEEKEGVSSCQKYLIKQANKQTYGL
jgi:hypothetical protein